MSANPSPVITEISTQIAQDMLLTSNVSQHVFQITEDKVRLAVLQHLERIEQRKAWHVPASLLVPLVAAFVAADFKDHLLKADQWFALFLFASLLTGAWLIRDVIRAYQAPSIEQFIEA